MHRTGKMRSSAISNGDTELEQLQSVRSDRASECLYITKRGTLDGVEKGATAIEEEVDSIVKRCVWTARRV